MERYKRPDTKNALSIAEAAKRDMDFTLDSLAVNESSGPTIVRNIYECFRMLGDALLTLKGIKISDHVMQVKQLLKLRVKTLRPMQLIDNMRILRHNINYYGHKPTILEVEDAISLAKACFNPVYTEVIKMINEVR